MVLQILRQIIGIATFGLGGDFKFWAYQHFQQIYQILYDWPGTLQSMGYLDSILIGTFFYTQGSPLAELTFLIFIVELYNLLPWSHYYHHQKSEVALDTKSFPNYSMLLRLIGYQTPRPRFRGLKRDGDIGKWKGT